MDSQALEKLVLMKMPYGKHAGRTLADLPGNYLAWFARAGFPKGELGELLELMHTLDHNGLRGLLAPIQRAHGLQAKSKLLWANDGSNAIALVGNARGVWRAALNRTNKYCRLRFNLCGNSFC